MSQILNARRLEDDRLLRGQGNFVDDQRIEDHAVGYVVRSSYPHAEILGIDVEIARSCPGVQLILTADELQQDNVGGLPCVSSFECQDAKPMFKPKYPILAKDRVRYVGQPVAFIVADTLNQALEAAETIDVDYQELPSASLIEKSQAADAVIWENAPNNLCFDWSAGDHSSVQLAMSQAAHVISIDVHHPRMAIAPIEPRAAIARFEPESQHYTLYVQTQGVHSVRRVLAQDVLNVPLDQLSVITQDVGGSFGMKIFTYPEYALALIAAEKLLRTVSWTATRSESFVADSHGRARTDRAQLAVDGEGNFLALAVSANVDLGAYLSYVGPSVPSLYAYTVIGHTYRIPHISYRCRGWFTNATPTDAYRGAGKPEMVCTLEQLIDKCAFELGRDRAEIRRKNFVKPADLPYHMTNGQVIDSGNFDQLLDLALEQSNWHTCFVRKKSSLLAGMLRGIGLGMYLHSTGGSPTEVCEVRLEQSGTVSVFTGSQSGGQGHETTLAHLVAEELEIDISRICVKQGDTRAIPTGGGTGGSSLVSISGSTVTRAAKRMLENAREQASDAMEVSALDLDYSKGSFIVPGTDRRLSLVQLADQLGPMDQSVGNCVGRAEFEGIKTTHPSGAYVVELQCDPETGVIELLQIVGVDDIGRILQPMLADGQLHGGWAQAVGTSLMEAVRFDEDDAGHVLSGSFMDYQLPRAADLPFFQLFKIETLCQTNPLGVKGVGEVANLGASGAIQNAISDMLSDAEFITLNGPATPHHVWKLLKG